MNKCARDPNWEGADSLDGYNMPSSRHFRLLSPHKEDGLGQAKEKGSEETKPIDT